MSSGGSHIGEGQLKAGCHCEWNSVLSSREVTFEGNMHERSIVLNPMSRSFRLCDKPPVCFKARDSGCVRALHIVYGHTVVPFWTIQCVTQKVLFAG